MSRDPAQLLSEADKAYSSAGSGFSFFGSRTEKYEHAVDLYDKAATAYRRQAGKQADTDEAKRAALEAGRQAGLILEKIAMIQGTKLDESHFMARTLEDAFKSYQKPCPEDAVRCLSQAIEHYLDKGKFYDAAKRMESLANYYKNDLGDQAKARSAYADAAQWYDNESGFDGHTNKTNLFAAELAALEGDYPDAIRRFEGAAKYHMSKDSLRGSVRSYLFRAGVCQLALDIVDARRALDRYRELDPSFPGTDEYRHFATLLEIVEKGDSDEYTVTVRGYNDTHPTPPLLHELYGRIRDSIVAKEEDFS